MQTFEPHLALLRQALGTDVQDCRAELIKTALGWSLVYRVTLTSSQGHPTRDSVIVKAINPNGPIDAFQAERELRFYQVIHPQLPIPKPGIYFLGTDEVSGWHVIIMEDLSYTHRIPQHPYQWSPSELKSVLQAYAYLHTASPPSLAYDWLVPRHESLLDFDRIPEQVSIIQRAGTWGALPALPDLIASAQESGEKYANAKMAIIHGDTTPTNAPLPSDLDLQPAMLIDWQDVGVGMPEFDLAYIDLQPFDSGRLIPRSELLSTYWHFRAEIENNGPSTFERAARQFHADVVTALWLTQAASRVTLQPFPEGSPQHIHWESQFGIVYNRLVELSDKI